MWDLPHLIQLRKARHALRAGRIDEAFAIATDARFGDHRKRQVLLEDLVAPLLDRAKHHLDAGRAEDALADVERARVAGGNRPALVDIREAALGRLRQARHMKDKERQLMASIEGHLGEGRLGAGAERLASAPEDRAEELRRRIERCRREAAEARDDARARLARGEIAPALERARAAYTSESDDRETRELLHEAAREAEGAISKALLEGSISVAVSIFERLGGLEEIAAAAERWREPVELCDKAARAIADRDWPRARVALKRILSIVPRASWASAAEKKLREVEDALAEIEAGPLGRRLSALGAGAPPAAVTRKAPAIPVLSARPVPAQLVEKSKRPRRFQLWVDGIGSYLVLTGDRVTVGRHGSSAKPDISLLAELESVHAEVLRVEQDYFLVPRGRATVGGRPVTRHLLADGDDVILGDRSRLTFRLPTSLSPTAIVELGQGLRLEGDVRKVILLDGHLIFGAGKGCHIATPRAEGRVILSAGADGFRCRAPVPLIIDGRTCGMDEPVPPGAHVEAGPLTFTLTEAEREGS